MDNKPDRLLHLDVLRGISIIGVILIHTISSSFNFWHQDSFTWTTLIATDQFFRVSVPLFVFISGYTLYLKYSSSFKFREFYSKRVARILPWYFVWSFIIYIYIFFTVNPGFVNYPTWKLILLGKVDYHLYFVSMIFQLYLLFPILLWLYKKFRHSLVFIIFLLEAILYLAFSLDAQEIIHLPWRFYDQQQYLFFGTWIFYFVLGFALSGRTLGNTKLNLGKYNFVFLLITTALFIFLVFNCLHLAATTVDTNIATRSTRIPVLLYATSFIVSALIYSNFFLKLNKHLLKGLLYFANISYLVYLIHTLVIRIISNYILPNSLLNLAIFTFIVLSLSIIAAQLSLWAAKLIPFYQLKKLFE